MRKIGVILGTFNPPHIGHLSLATAALQIIDGIIFIPAYQNPWKRYYNNFLNRYYMLEELVSGYSKIYVSAVESSLEKVDGSVPSYTVLKRMGELYSDSIVYPIITLETANEIERWINGDWILKEFKFIVVGPGYLPSNLMVERRIEGLNIKVTKKS